MDDDLRDALIAWQDGDISPDRRAILLEKIRTNEEFRKELSELIWTLSSSKVARSPEPRWLELIELIDQPSNSEEDSLTLRMKEQIRNEPVRFVPVWWRSLAAMAMALFLVAGGMLCWVSLAASRTNDGPPLAVFLTQKENTLLSAGPVRLKSGTARIQFTSGVTIDLEGPAHLDLLSRDRIRCFEGRMRMVVPEGEEGFIVETPEGEIRDLGTELGIVVGRGTASRVMVIDGEAEVSVKKRGQDGVRSALLRKNERAEFEAKTGSIRPGPEETDFPTASPQLPPLSLPDDYPERILSGKPVHYWRMNRIEDGLIPNEIDSAAPLTPVGSISFDERNGLITFHGNEAPGSLIMKEAWKTPSDHYSIELWFATDQIGRMDVAALTLPNAYNHHLSLLEIGGLRPNQGDEPGVVRYLLRWPAGRSSGMNLFSPPEGLSYLWHHVVAQHEKGQMELFVNGTFRGTADSGVIPSEIPASWQFGCLFEGETLSSNMKRVFSGHLAEIAVYERLLTPAEIKSRYQAKDL